jgi:hypothetical protein
MATKGRLRVRSVPDPQPTLDLESARGQPPDFIFALAASQSALDMDVKPWPLQLF